MTCRSRIVVAACVMTAFLGFAVHSVLGQVRREPHVPAPQPVSVPPPHVCVGLNGIERDNGDRCTFDLAIAGPFFAGPPPKDCTFLITLAATCFAPTGGVSCSGHQTLRVSCGLTSEHFSVCGIDFVVQTIDPDGDGPHVPPPFFGVTHCDQVEIVPL